MRFLTLWSASSKKEKVETLDHFDFGTSTFFVFFAIRSATFKNSMKGP